MKYFTFQPQFHASIIGGVKTSTIRTKQKVQIGERFALRYWTGSPYRSKMGILGTATCCEAAEVCIGFDTIRIDGVAVDESIVARLEGFTSAGELRAWFEKNHDVVFLGWIHVWESFMPYAACGSGGDMLCLECGKPVHPGHPSYANGYDEAMNIATSNCCTSRTAADLRPIARVDRAGAAEPANHNNPSSPAPVERLDGPTRLTEQKP